MKESKYRKAGIYIYKDIEILRYIERERRERGRDI
jgi:hypothetical protein